MRYINRSTPVYGPPLACRQDCKPCLWPSILCQKAAYPMMWMRWQLRSWWWQGVILHSGWLLSNPIRSEQSVDIIWRNWPQHLPIPAQNVYTWRDRWQVVQVQEIFVHNDLGWTAKVIRKLDLELWYNSSTLFTMRISFSTSTDRLFACTMTLYSGFECAGSTICAADDGFSRYLSISCGTDK